MRAKVKVYSDGYVSVVPWAAPADVFVMEL